MPVYGSSMLVHVVAVALLAPLVTLRAQGDCSQTDVRTRARTGSNGITGRYRAGDDILYLATCGDTVAVSPVLWSSIEYALRVGPDSFAVYDRPARTIVVVRDHDRITGVRTTGLPIAASFSRESRNAASLPVEHLLFDADGRAAAKLLTGAGATPEKAAQVTDDVFSNFPSRHYIVASVLRQLVVRWPADVRLARQEAEALAETGDTAAARIAAHRARTFAPTDTGIARILTWLDGAIAMPDTGWRLPFPPESVLAAPTSSEIAAAWATIAARDHSARDVKVIYRGGLVIHGDSFTVTMVAHESGGHTHVGAVVAPVSPLPACCATIVDLKGTNARYSPLQLDHGPPSLRVLGTGARNYIFVVPAYRGEIIHFAGQDFTADGDRTDGWDGGADDALSFLAAAASLDSRVDPSRSCIFGRSRGGAVALLMAEREPRIRCVVAVSPAADWFDAMWSNNWPKVTLLRVALRSHAGVFAGSPGQFIEWVLAPVARGERTLADARQKMIAMSPVYYAGRLPPLLAFFGAEDPGVLSRNAVMLDSALHRLSAKDDRTVYLARMAGHDTDPAEVVRLVPAFLARHLETPVGERWPGSDAR